MSVCYVDTSALAKRYFNEPRADETDAYLMEQSMLVITRLTAVEMRSLLARRRRDNELDAALEARVYSAFREDVRLGHFTEHEVTAEAFEGAVQILTQLTDVPLRTLDALHLASVQMLGVERLVTADRRMRDSAANLDIPVDYFG